jgi:hypothetical protein
MSIASIAKSIGKNGTYQIRSASGESLHVNVRIIDVRSAFGRIDYRIEPIQGTGQVWVSADSISNVN